MTFRYLSFLLPYVAILAIGCTQEPAPEKSVTVSPSTIQVSAAGTVSESLNVDTEDDWTAKSSDESWLTVSVVKKAIGGKIVVTVAPNIEAEGKASKERRGNITVTTAGGKTASVSVIQAGEATSFTVKAGQTQFDADGGTLSVTVGFNVSYNVTIGADWIKETTLKSVREDVRTFLIEKNEAEARTAEITFTPEQGQEQKITVTQDAPQPKPQTIRILAIGNSFSADAVEQELYGLFEAVGQDVIIGDMYIGGCPLEKHAANATSDAAAYSYRKIVNGKMTKTADVKLSTALADEPWDYVSLQEGAGFHGFYNTTYKGTTHSMEPHLTTLVNYVLEKCANKKVKLVYHAPWAAKKGYDGVKFSYYGYDQKVMYDMICTATKEVLAAHPEFRLCMNVMDAIQNARTSYFGDDMNRDGWHLNYTTGRYTAGCLWFEKIMGQSVVGNTYHPSTISAENALVCQTAAHEACEHPYTVTDLSYFPKPEEEPQPAKKVLAKWYFTPDRAVSDGYIKTWTGQDKIGVITYSNAPGERGYINSNEVEGGKLSYVQIDKTQWPAEAAGLCIFDVSNGGQPVIYAPMPGDYWQIETNAGYDLDEGSRIHVVYRYNPGNYGAKYWRVEYRDGQEWKPAFATSKMTIEKSGEQIEYNKAFTSEQETVEFTVVLENPNKDFAVRQVCCSTYQVNDKWFESPNAKSTSRIAGDPKNPEKPLPEIDIML